MDALNDRYAAPAASVSAVLEDRFRLELDEPARVDELVAALRGGHTYVNVHSSKWPGGEIRAQITD